MYTFFGGVAFFSHIGGGFAEYCGEGSCYFRTALLGLKSLAESSESFSAVLKGLRILETGSCFTLKDFGNGVVFHP